MATAVKRAILLRYHEVALKGANRGWFESRLAQNAKKILARVVEGPFDVKRLGSRIMVSTPLTPSVQEQLSYLFGCTGYSPIRFVPTQLDALIVAAKEETLEWLKHHPAPKTFRVRTRRSEKALPQRSLDIDIAVGSAIREYLGEATVNLTKADFTLWIEVHEGESFIWTQKFTGASGLPVGTNGHLLSLISGGIDSPVASIQALKRGATLSYIHFYGTPFVGPEALEKVEDLVRIINRYHPRVDKFSGSLWIIPFGKIQEKIALCTEAKLRTVLYRRMMLRIVSALSSRGKSVGIITGESIGQVASQTLENMAVINQASSIPVLRPLLTFDKDEIIKLAKTYGTFSTSILPAADCCTLFADRHPVIRCTPEQVLAEEQKLELTHPIDSLVAEAIAGLKRRPL